LSRDGGADAREPPPKLSRPRIEDRAKIPEKDCNNNSTALSLGAARCYDSTVMGSPATDGVSGAGVPHLISTAWTIAALIIFLFKQLVADFLLQTSWMANGKEQPHGWFAPLLAHVLVHTAATLIIFVVLAPVYFWMAAVDFVVHFAIDRCKGLLNRAFDTGPTKTGFWWLIGIDQTLHHLTHLGFALLIAVVHTP
jgi:uncharacterized protein DUF3307